MKFKKVCALGVTTSADNMNAAAFIETEITSLAWICATFQEIPGAGPGLGVFSIEADQSFLVRVSSDSDTVERLASLGLDPASLGLDPSVFFLRAMSLSAIVQRLKVATASGHLLIGFDIQTAIDTINRHLKMEDEGGGPIETSYLDLGVFASDVLQLAHYQTAGEKIKPETVYRVPDIGEAWQHFYGAKLPKIMTAATRAVMGFRVFEQVATTLAAASRKG